MKFGHSLQNVLSFIFVVITILALVHEASAKVAEYTELKNEPDWFSFGKTFNVYNGQKPKIPTPTPNVKKPVPAAPVNQVIPNDGGRFNTRPNQKPTPTPVRPNKPLPVINVQQPSSDGFVDNFDDDGGGEITRPGTTTRPGGNVQSKPTNTSAINAAHGARKIFATQYQTCEVLNSGLGVRERTSIGKYTSPARLVDQLAKRPDLYPKNQCVDKSKSHFGYAWGGKARTTKTTLDVHRGLDCSGFLSAAYGASGLKLTPGSSMGRKRNTNQMNQLAPPNSNTCFKFPSGSVTQALRPGDLLNQGSTSDTRRHMVMIDSVGKDPFGLNKVKSYNGCSYMKYRNFNFTYIHSSKYRGSYSRTSGRYVANGIHRVHARKMYSAGIRKGLMVYAKKVCRAHFGRKNVKFSKVSVGKGKKFVLLRHKGTDNCVGKPLRIKREQCVGSCNGRIDQG